MTDNYCVIIAGDAQTTLERNVYRMEGAVQGALNAGCTLQGGASFTNWKLQNGNNMFGFTQAVTCKSPCAQVMKVDANGNTVIINSSSDILSEASSNFKKLAINFADASAKFESGFTDYAPDQKEDIKFASGVKAIPGLYKGYLLGGTNLSDDLYMFVSTKVIGLSPNANYSLAINKVTIATNVPKGQAGVGGRPGEDVWIKVGAYNEHPEEVLRESNYVTTNFDHGNQSNDGHNAFVIGNFAKQSEDKSKNYELKDLISHKHLDVVSNSHGEMWLIFGTDSGFEARTDAYFISADVNLVLKQGADGVANADHIEL